MKRGRDIPLHGVMFASDLKQGTMPFAQLVQERVARTIECLAKLRPETGFGIFYKDLRYHIGKCAGQEYENMRMSNAKWLRIRVEVEQCSDSKMLELSGFDKCNVKQRNHYVYDSFTIDFWCWNLSIQSYKLATDYVKSLIPEDLYDTRKYGVEYSGFCTDADDPTFINDESIIASCFEERASKIVQWFGTEK